MAEKTNFYDLIKTTAGSLGLILPAYDLSSQPRIVDIPHNVKKVRIPRTFALGIFTDATLERMYKEGRFKIEPEKAFEAEVAEIFFPVEDKINVVAEEEIIKMLKTGNRVGIKKLLAEDSVNRDNVIVLARDNINDISISMVEDLNKILGVELQVED